MKKFIFFFVVVAALGGSVHAENLTLTTYYPAPSGAYKSLRTHNMCVGSACANGTVAGNNLYVQGNIGIGTPAPGFALQIGSGISMHGMFSTGNDALIQGNLEVGGMFFGDGSRLTGVAAVPGGADKGVQYNDGGLTLSGADDFVFDKVTGNVGIGTTVPTQRLEVIGNALLPSAIGMAQGNLYLGGNTAVGINGLRFFSVDASGGGFMDVRASTADKGIIFRADLINGGTERMRITAGGNVGIGTANPLATLDVNNTLRLTPVTGNAAAQTGGVDGSIRYSSTVNEFLFKKGGTWQVLNGSASAPVCRTFKKTSALPTDDLSASCSEFESNDYPLMVSGGCFFRGEVPGSAGENWRVDNCSWPSYSVAGDPPFLASGTGDENTWYCKDRTAHAEVKHVFVRCCKWQ